MRIAIAYHFNDHQWLGGRNYYASLFAAVKSVAPPTLQMVLVLGKKTVSTLPDEFPWLEVLRTPLMDRMHPLWLARQVTLRYFQNDYLLALYLRRHRIDLLSHSGYLGRWSRIPSLPWLSDFQFMRLPQYWTAKQIAWSVTRYNNACRHGQGVIVSSHDAAHDLRDFAPWNTKPVHVLQFVSNPVNVTSLPSVQTLRDKYGLPTTYFHVPNQFWSNKNHRLIIDALTLLKTNGVDAVVVCTGKPFDARMPGYFDELMAYARECKVDDRFVVLGLVPHQDLQGVMAHAVAVINPSRFEGWSTSVEEAKTMQKPLLLSDLRVHHEQAPDGGLFFGVDDVAGLATHIALVMKEQITTLNHVAIEESYDQRLSMFGKTYLSIIEDCIFKNERGVY